MSLFYLHCLNQQSALKSAFAKLPIFSFICRMFPIWVSFMSFIWDCHLSVAQLIIEEGKFMPWETNTLAAVMPAG